MAGGGKGRGVGGRVLLQGPVSEQTTRRVHLHVCSVSALCLRSINNPDGGNCCTVTCHTYSNGENTNNMCGLCF